MSENDAISRISGIKMPDYYLDYYSNLSKDTYTIFEHAALAKSSPLPELPRGLGAITA